MNYRTVQILAAEDCTTAATKTIDINLTDTISRITIQLKATNSDSVPDGHPAKMLKKIELVDGSDVLFSLTGIEAQALNWYHNKVLPWNSLRYINDVQCIAVCHLDFGRYLMDPDLALDPSRFKNLQLKITHDDGLGGCTSDAATLSVFAHVFDEKKISPRGFLMCKEIKSYSKGDATHEYTDLPTDYPIRKMLLQSLVAGKQPWEQYNKIKLSEDHDKRVPINNLSTSDWLKIVDTEDWIVEEVYVEGTGSQQAAYITPSYNIGVTDAGYLSDNVSYQSAPSYGGVVYWLAESTEQDSLLVRGLCPHGATEIPFGNQNDVGDWYDVRKIRSLVLDITSGSTATGTIEIVLQQYRHY